LRNRPRNHAFDGKATSLLAGKTTGKGRHLKTNTTSPEAEFEHREWSTGRVPFSSTGSGLLDVFLLYARFHEWLNAPESPKAQKPVAIEKPKKAETIPPFDIQEIPGAMRKLKMPVSARLMERWFAGNLNYSPRDVDEHAEVNQDGMRYPPNMYDTTTITLDWVLRFSRARK
jgi:hypothetical protein